MAEIYFPSLSDSGWTTSSSQIVETMFAQFFLTDYSQTQLYVKKVSSFAYVIEQGQGDVLMTIDLLRSTLLSYFGRQFPHVTVDIKDSTDPKTPMQVSLTLYLTVTDSNGVEINLSKIIQTSDGKLKQILDVNNNGN